MIKSNFTKVPWLKQRTLNKATFHKSDLGYCRVVVPASSSSCVLSLFRDERVHRTKLKQVHY